MSTIVLGPPGTGKTETLLTKVEEYLKETDPDKIGYFAFTQKAANEARDRAIKKFNLTEDDLPYFRTLHSLAFRKLGIKKENVMQPHHYKDLGETLKLPLSVPAWDNDESHAFFSSESEELNIISKAKHKQIKVEQQYDLGEHSKEVSREKLIILANELEIYKREYGLIDFHDMIANFIKSDKCPKFDATFIDEAQDLSKVQWDMAKNIWKKTEDSFIAGDDDQAIFRWAGADVDSFIALDGKKIVGVSSLWKRKGNVGINTGFSGVHKDYRCMGIASSLKHTALKWAKKKQYPWVRTENDSTNKGMLGINIKAGFKPMPSWLFMSKVVKKL